MKYPTITILAIASFIIAFLFFSTNSIEIKSDESVSLRTLHHKALENLPFKNSKALTKIERHELGLPPNLYYEQLYELTLDPTTGRPMPENLSKIKKDLKLKRSVQRGVGDTQNPWVDRGPNNEGGRTRGIMFDPNDINNPDPADDYTRVFAGGVSGGLWVNDDITDANSPWSLIEGIDGSISVTSIISDPNNPLIMYIGSGESYTSGDAVGRGVWRSLDGGLTWTIVLGGFDGFSGSDVNGIFYVNDVVARDNNGVTEIFAAVSPAIYKYSNTPRNSMGLDSYGVYKSNDNGNSWQRLNITDFSGLHKNPTDLEIDTNNNVWMTTGRNIDGSFGGEIFRSTNGTTFLEINSIDNARRTELEISQNDPNLMWIAANVNGEVDLFQTTDGMATIEKMNEPNDPDEGISATDFTRNQAFYNLVIEADENDRLYVGGIDLFRSTTQGITWSLISKWANTTGLTDKNVSLVHADQHAIVFRPNDQDQIVFGNDGGVYYSEDITVASSSTTAIESRNLEYNTIQFYYGAIGTASNGNDDIVGGTQDNGTPFLLGGVDGTNPFTDFFGGDGGFTELDDDYMIQSYPFNTHNFVNYPLLNDFYRLSTDETLDGATNGSFINEAELDKNLDILYTNASNADVVRIERISDFKNETDIEKKMLTNSRLTSSPSAMKISPYTTGASNLYVGTRAGTLLRAAGADIAPIWKDITGPNFVGSISDIEFGKSEDEIFVTMHNYGVDSVWFTSDGGDSWRNIEGNLPDLPVKCILQNPLQPEELIIGTELGVWFCSDFTVDNPNWEQSYNGMSDITVVDLDLRRSDNLVLASTHGRGMFTSNFTAESLSLSENLAKDNQFRVYPTVSDGKIKITALSDYDDAEIKIFDLHGKVVYKSRLDLDYLENVVELNLSAGLYIVNINVDNYTETKRIVLE